MCALGGASNSLPSTKLVRPVLMGAGKRARVSEEGLNEVSEEVLNEEDRIKYYEFSDLIDDEYQDMPKLDTERSIRR